MHDLVRRYEQLPCFTVLPKITRTNQHRQHVILVLKGGPVMLVSAVCTDTLCPGIGTWVRWIILQDMEYRDRLPIESAGFLMGE